MDYFDSLSDLLKIEWEEDKRQYVEQTEKTSAATRREMGLCWYPIAIRGTEMGRGEYLIVEAERTTHHELNHQFRFGMPAAIFSNHDPQTDRVEGVVSHISGNRIKITLRTDELPEWSRTGKLGIDLLFDDNSYDEMKNALKKAKAVQKENASKIISLLSGHGNPTFKDRNSFYKNPLLNDSQNEAVEKILNANELAIVHGPPGTGKTTTIVQAIMALLKHDCKRILVCAPSNTAVDLLSEKLSVEGVNVIRVGNPVRVGERLQSITLDSKVSAHEMMKEAKKLKKQAQEYKNMAHKYKRNFGREERDQRKLLFDEALKIMREVENTEKYIMEDLFGKAQVIAATLVGANHFTVSGLKYDALIIDEAGQALEPACWIPLLKSEKVILAGDHCQLPPTIKSEVAAKNGLNKTLLEKCVSRYPESVSLLKEQYRMNHKIMSYSSKVFYNNLLKAAPSVSDQLLFDQDLPVLFIDTAGCSYSEEPDGTSVKNPEEGKFVIDHLTALVEEMKSKGLDKKLPEIAIIAPYRQQVLYIQGLLDQHEQIKAYKPFITVNTVDSFQGQERDIVYISMTRSNDKNEIGFLADIRRMNVAMTRAKKKLVVVGDSGTVSTHKFYKGFIEYVSEIDGYKSAWEFLG